MSQFTRYLEDNSGKKERNKNKKQKQKYEIQTSVKINNDWCRLETFIMKVQFYGMISKGHTS